MRNRRQYPRPRRFLREEFSRRHPVTIMNRFRDLLCPLIIFRIGVSGLNRTRRATSQWPCSGERHRRDGERSFVRIAIVFYWNSRSAIRTDCPDVRDDFSKPRSISGVIIFHDSLGTGVFGLRFRMTSNLYSSFQQTLLECHIRHAQNLGHGKHGHPLLNVHAL